MNTMTAVERPILFSGQMVKAILAGRKSQTRRVVKPQPRRGRGMAMIYRDQPDRLYDAVEEGGGRDPRFWTCPYGCVGDRLWVREAWAIRDCGSRVPARAECWPDGFPVHRLAYRATDEAPCVTMKGEASWWNVRSPIHMPRWASRITLEITSVRVERVRDISVEDCCREGAPIYDDCPNQTHAVRTWYEELWERINGMKFPWASNPWVWVIDFKQV